MWRRRGRHTAARYWKRAGTRNAIRVERAASPFVYRNKFQKIQNRRYSNKPSSLSELSESFLNGSSAAYIDELYEKWEENNASVSSSWDQFFRNVVSGNPPGKAATPIRPFSKVASGEAGNSMPTDRIVAIMLLIRAYQVRGHTIARVNPLTNEPLTATPPELLPSTYGFSEEDMDTHFDLGETDFLSGFLRGVHTLRTLLKRLRETYSGTYGVEYMHINDRAECNWIRQRLETPEHYSFSKEDKHLILRQLADSELFEQFLENKYTRVKRFGLDGCESLVPGMKSMIDTLSALGGENIVLGMPHRGRLNVLANVMQKPLATILNEFDPEGDQHDDHGLGSGDVKYHLGSSAKRKTRRGQEIKISLVANPSHLEAVNPVVLGKAKAKQHFLYSKSRSDLESKTKVAPILLHGDAAFSGQGISYETFDMTLFKSFNTGGTIHIVVNNQIGFTTDTINSRVPSASKYCTDIAKTAGAPIFHVNGEDPEAVVFVMALAAEYRQAFKKDVVVDIFCYRREGHNEGDEPSFTQPLMYQIISKKKNLLDMYSKRLTDEGTITAEEVQEIKKKIMANYNNIFDNKAEFLEKKVDWLDNFWKGFKPRNDFAAIQNTGISEDVYETVGTALTTIPEDFTPNRKLKAIYKRKKQVLDGRQGIDWATAEGLAFGSLMLEGNLVRLTGQDVERGTFSHRHAVLHDSKTDNTYTPLNSLEESKYNLEVHNSSLSEFGVLGFEVGYSLESPNALVLWEAQFGDFANGAQVIFDQFITSGEQKWMRQSGLTVLLPHGYDGQGPEHSSCRVERFLQMSDCDPHHMPDDLHESQTMQIQRSNFQIVNCTTPANYFHALRRQLCREFRKPLIVVAPKRLLRHPQCVSDASEFTGETRFERVISKQSVKLVEPEKVRRVLFCTGNVYYDLAGEREQADIDDVAIVRVEQLTPAPFDRIQEVSREYPNAEVYWVQEEPKNMGAWSFMYQVLRTSMKDQRGAAFEPVYVGRKVAASPATGSHKTHKRQLREILTNSFAK